MSPLNETYQAYTTIAGAVISAISAVIAYRAFKNTRKTARNAQEMSVRQGFEQRYTLLLTQHNALHDALCEYLNNTQMVVNRNGYELELSGAIDRYDALEHYFYYLTGHPVISPYMRVLFHLLKHINSDPYIMDKTDAEKRRYSSPLRSYIRNDVLFLIAINALNVRSDRLKDAGYPEYQKLLHRFNFFEHAVFSNPWKANEPFAKTIKSLREYREHDVDIRDNLAVEIYHIEQIFRSKLSFVLKICRDAMEKGQIPEPGAMFFERNEDGQNIKMKPEDCLATPFLTCAAIYNSPHTRALQLAQQSCSRYFFQQCKDKYYAERKRYDECQSVVQYIGGQYANKDGLIKNIASPYELKKLASSTPAYERNKIIMVPASGASENVITLDDIYTDIDAYFEFQHVKWPEDESLFFDNLKLRICELLEQSMNSLIRNYQHKFEVNETKRSWIKGFLRKP
ncbi:hypothetical protein F9441_20775 [Escherichia coli]|nr:hypothetical protein [Escherichia coli]